MNQYRNRTGIVFLTLILVFCLTASMDAYVLKGPHILELMTSKYGKAKRLLVSQNLILYANDPQRGQVELKETLRYIFPEVFRSDIRSENAHRIHVVSGNAVLTAIDGKITTESETDFDRYKDILLYHYREVLHERLTLLGVDVSVTSLGRFQDKIAYILGAQYPNESSSQIWVEKETFKPLRWLIIKNTPDDQPNVLDIQYQNWQQFENNWYPMNTLFFENGRLVREIRVDSIRVNPSFARDLFDIRYLKKIYQPVASVTPDQQESEGINEIQKTIEDFKKIYE